MAREQPVALEVSAAGPKAVAVALGGCVSSLQPPPKASALGHWQTPSPAKAGTSMSMRRRDTSGRSHGAANTRAHGVHVWPQVSGISKADLEAVLVDSDYANAVVTESIDAGTVPDAGLAARVPLLTVAAGAMAAALLALL